MVFLKTNERYGGLSNMAPGFPIVVNGTRVKTSEALYQACRFPHLPGVQRQIISENSPMTAKMRSKPHRNNSREDWDFVRVKIMRWCLNVKLAQNWKEFGRLLLATSGRPIVEHSRRDDFWGAKLLDDNTLVGANVLGRLLMELRDSMMLKPIADFREVSPPMVDNFLLFGQPIEMIAGNPTEELNKFIEPLNSKLEASPIQDSPQLSFFDRF